ncbi:MAG: hypothetical protein HUU55_23925 [Myxococcales bacterium]|nr:hypothetical protein [Myxococcales bacterium]
MRNVNIRTALVLVTTVISACDDDTTSSHDSTSGTESITAAEVVALPVAPVDATNVQSWLEDLLQRLQTQSEQVSTFETTLNNHNQRIEVLESSVTPRVVPPSAADVSFDDEATWVKGVSVQTFGESLDTKVKQLDGTLNSVKIDQSTTQQQVDDLDDELRATQEELDEVAFNASAVIGAYDVLVETSLTPVSEGDAVPEAYPYNNTVHGALKKTWEYLEPIIQLTSQACPDEMVLVKDVICVDKVKYYEGGVPTALPWQIASLKCNEVGKRLCSPTEFVAYCSYPTQYLPQSELAGVQTLKSPEWMDQLTGPGLMAFVGSGFQCDTIAAVDATKFQNFRCCKTPTPQAGKN